MSSEALNTPNQQVIASVERLLSWNDTYKVQVESVANRISELGRMTADSTADYSRVVDQSADLAKASQDVQALFARLENDTHQLTKIAEEMHSVLRPSVGGLQNIDKNIVSHVESLARSVADHQRMVAEMLMTNADAIRHALQNVTKNLDGISSAANRQAAMLDEALSGHGHQPTSHQQPNHQQPTHQQPSHQQASHHQSDNQRHAVEQQHPRSHAPDHHQVDHHQADHHHAGDHHVGTAPDDGHHSVGLSQRQLAALSETLTADKAMPMANTGT